MKFKSNKLQDVVTYIVDNRGKTPPLAEEGFELIEINAITARYKFPRYELVKKLVSEDTYNTWFRTGHPQKGDILISTVGAIGFVAIMGEDRGCVAQNLIAIRPNREMASPDYLYYFLAWDRTQQCLKNLDIGVAQPSIKVPHLLSYIDVYMPPLPTQHKIAAILSAYDDLIENNLRRIKVLEEMAQLIYREWFVNFRFPGHEGVRMVDSELGMIPEGWEVKLIGEVIQTLGGSTPSTKNPQCWENGDVVWFIPTDLTRSGSMFIFDSEKKITRFGLKNSSARLFPAYSVMMTSRATIGVTAINTREACTNQGFITCIPNDRLSLYHIYFWIQDNLEKITSIASGATYKEINRTEFRSLPIVMPKDEIERIFLKMFAPIGKQIEVLLAKTANLRQTRDLLLPKLISGELDVSELDIDMEGAPQ
jgi:type I restriction enzyme S subunit